VAPAGCDDWAPPPKIDRALVKALARAHRWRRLLEEGRFGTLAELADAERISRSYVCRVLRLMLLAPDIVERILDGRPTAGLAEFLKPFSVAWERQRDRLLRQTVPRTLPAVSRRPEQQRDAIWRCQDRLFDTRKIWRARALHWAG
jgi:hypothetical protein